MKTAVTEGVEAQLPSENLAWLYYELGEYETQAGDAAPPMRLTWPRSTPIPAIIALWPLWASSGEQRQICGSNRALSKGHRGRAHADLCRRTGRPVREGRQSAEARKQYQLVEYIGLLGHINQVLHNRDLALFYADHDMKLSEALDLAQKEFEVRHDIYTWDALAWALYKNGKYQEAEDAIDNALRSGTGTALLFFHAGMIAEAKTQRPVQARESLKRRSNQSPVSRHICRSGQATACGLGKRAHTNCRQGERPCSVSALLLGYFF